MRLSRITSLMNTSIIIEDLNVHLPSKGSSKTIDSSAADRSQDLKRYRNWVRVEVIPEPKPMPIWPFIKSPEVPSPLVAAPTSLSPPPLTPSVPVTVAGVEDLRQSVNRIHEMLAVLVARSDVSPETIFVTQAALEKVSKDKDVPIFIPSSIVPKNVDARIQSRDGEVVKDDMDASLAALRKARKS